MSEVALYLDGAVEDSKENARHNSPSSRFDQSRHSNFSKKNLQSSLPLERYLDGAVGGSKQNCATHLPQLGLQLAHPRLRLRETAPSITGVEAFLVEPHGAP